MLEDLFIKVVSSISDFLTSKKYSLAIVFREQFIIISNITKCYAFFVNLLIMVDIYFFPFGSIGNYDVSADKELFHILIS